MGPAIERYGSTPLISTFARRIRQPAEKAGFSIQSILSYPLAYFGSELIFAVDRLG